MGQKSHTWAPLSCIHYTGRKTSARICKPFKEPKNRFPAGGPVRQLYLTQQPAKLHRLGGIDSLEPITGLIKRLQIRAHRLFALVSIGSRSNVTPFKASIPASLGEKKEDSHYRRKTRLIEGNAKCRRHLKKLTCKGTLRQVFICLRPRFPQTPPLPPYTLYNIVYTYIIQYTYSHREEGEVVRIEPETRLEGQQFTRVCRKYQHD